MPRYAIVEGRSKKITDGSLADDEANQVAVAAARADCAWRLDERLKQLIAAGETTAKHATTVLGDPGWEYDTAVVQGHVAY